MRLWTYILALLAASIIFSSLAGGVPNHAVALTLEPVNVSRQG